jgi:aryl-alcohol dehydrogenase-like predicted oxidoreductase
MSMPHRPLGASGLVVSVVGWSTGALARPSGLATPAALVRAALDAEIDLFDSAPEGDAQDTLARVLRGHRRHVALGARCVASAGPSAFSPLDRAWRPEEVRLRLEASLRHLQTDWLDLWLLHDPPLEALEDDELWAQLAEDRQAGWVRAVGVAVDGEDEARAALRLGGLDVLAVPLSLAEVEPGRSLAVEAVPREVAVLAEHAFGGNGGVALQRFVAGLVHPDTERTHDQAALAGVMSLPGVTSVLSPAATASQIGEHAGAAAWPLSDSETGLLAARLDEARESRREP